MLSELAICYLLCGGAGAGAVFVSSLIDLWTAPSLLYSSYRQELSVARFDSALSIDRAISWTHASGSAILAFGVLCLLTDLGSPDRALLIFLSPAATPLTFGAFSLLILLVFVSVTLAAEYLSFAVSRLVVSIVEAMLLPVAVVVMAYTGVLLNSVEAVPLWSVSLIPVMFTASSLSCGCALFALVSFLADQGRTIQSEGVLFAQVSKRVFIADTCIIIFEAALVLIFFAQSSQVGGNTTLLYSYQILFDFTDGWVSSSWWIAYIGCGIVVPLMIYLLLFTQSRKRLIDVGRLCFIVAIFILIGSAGLRFGIAEAGQKAPVSMSDAVAFRQAEYEEDGFSREDSHGSF